MPLITLILAVCLALFFMFLVLKLITEEDKTAFKLMEEIQKVIGGNISEYKIFHYQLTLKGKYKNREIECLYIRYPRQFNVNSKITFNLKLLNDPKIKHFPFLYPRIAEKIRLKKGTLVYKFIISYSPKTVKNVITNILDELLQAEKKLEKEGGQVLNFSIVRKSKDRTDDASAPSRREDEG
jgi:hypothetical protein